MIVLSFLYKRGIRIIMVRSILRFKMFQIVVLQVFLLPLIIFILYLIILFVGLTINIPDMPHLTINKDSKPLDISAGAESSVLINLECKRPFADIPTFEVSFTVSGLSKMKYQLRLPVTSVSFFDPVPSDKDTYMQRWKLLDGSDLQEIFATSKTVDQTFVENIRSNIFPLLHLGLADGLDAATPSATGSAAFKTGTQVKKYL